MMINEGLNKRPTGHFARQRLVWILPECAGTQLCTLGVDMRFRNIMMSLAIITLFGCGNDPETIQISINDVVLRAELARTPENRETGLMYRKKMPDDY